MGRKFINHGKTRLFILSVFIAILKDEVICVNLIPYFYILRQNPVSVLVNVLSGYQEKIKGFFHLGGLSFKSNIRNSNCIHLIAHPTISVQLQPPMTS